ncbi:MAG: hypothetical protein A3I66_02035 [Burkholderiales bacterium RIFCSPLOWO2_02_FULL_57_36]|nr:MAG: hypothetical protein A3I66_02035 [Burkholderiales bacterium RIFCSPLOWO2_02_FULL_57_36]
MIRLLIADDHHILRAGLRTVLHGVSDIEVVGEAIDGEDAMRKVCDTECNAVLLDINMPKLDGFEVLARIRRKNPDLPVLMISQLPDKQYAMRAFKAGANGYIMKNCEPAQLIEAIRCVAAGKRYVSRDFSDVLLDKMINPSENLPHLLLSGREVQIFELLVSGLGLTEIADMICISRKTVTTYRMRILEKMQLQSNADLIKYAIYHDLLRDQM